MHNENRRSDVIEAYADEPVHLGHIAHTLRRYRVAIVLATAALVLAYLVVAATAYLFTTSQVIASLPFILNFNGADVGEYPNGLKFSVADLTSNAVLTEVYAMNDLRRFIGVQQFGRAVYIIESNAMLERLTTDYQSKLSDPKLTPVDRERIEREFDSKYAGISKSGYAINFLITNDTRRVPRSVLQKSLRDILAVWARRAAIEKKAFDFQVSVLSTNILDRSEVESNDYLMPLLLLRRRVEDVMSNLDAISSVPGAELVRTTRGHTSIDELRLRLDALVRFRLEPLIARARASGQLGPAAVAIQILRAQLAYDERLLATAKMREEAIRNALRNYDSQPSAANFTPERNKADSAAAPSAHTAETVMPQLSESFLDRIVELSKVSGDRAYRQKLNDDIKNAALATIPLEATVGYDRELIDTFEKPLTADRMPTPALTREFETVFTRIGQIIEEMNNLFQMASRQLNPSTELYRVTGPVVFRVDRTISLTRLLAGGVVTTLVGFTAIIVIVLLHNRIREEELMENNANAADALAS